MRRAHGLATSKRQAFCDSTSSCDNGRHTITFLMLPTAAGAVPGGVFITNTGTRESYRAAFELLADELGTRAFGGQGYPEIIMTDDSQPERDALRDVWGLAKLLLCLFHISQAVWRWLLDAKHGIQKEHRQSLMHDFLILCRSKSELEAFKLYVACCRNGKEYSNYVDYMENLWQRREEWCLFYR